MSLCVYVIKNERGPVKVGADVKPMRMLGLIKTASPDELTLDFLASVDRDARSIEQRAHSMLAEFRIVRDWFDVSVEEAVASVQAAAEELGLLLTRQAPPGNPPVPVGRARYLFRFKGEGRV
jgi:hypothetical protein